MTLIVDVHAHLDHSDFSKDLDQVIARAKAAGVKAIITNGINPETNRKTLELAEKYDIVKAALGLYPGDVLRKDIEEGYPLKDEEFDIDSEIDFIKKNKNKIIALGECGLDFVRSDAFERKGQIEVFEKMIALAENINKPIIVHSRKAEQSVIDVLESSSIKKVVLHCFCGKKGLIKKAEDMAYYFSIPCNIVRAHNFQYLVNKVNLSRLLTETDCPCLSPYVGRRNEPAFIVETLKKIAEIKKMEVEEVEKNIFMNYQALF